MAVYAIGDVQGCFNELQALLRLVKFSRHHDHLWFVGDLVNRGPHSLAVLRFVRSLDDHAVVVLGNHDLHLLASAVGARTPKRKDTFSDILEAPEHDELLGWLRMQPLLHRDLEIGFAMVHAGVAPQWTLDQAMEYAAEISAVLRSDDYAEFFAHMYGDTPVLWDDRLRGWPRLRFITNALTRIRYCDRHAALQMTATGSPQHEDQSLTPWYAADQRSHDAVPIVFGHWATLQLSCPLDPGYGVHHVDTGCVWGGTLRALRLDDLRVFEVPAGSV